MFPPITVVETPGFMRDAEKRLPDVEREALIRFLANDPLAGDVIPETGGARKIR